MLCHPHDYLSRFLGTLRNRFLGCECRNVLICQEETWYALCKAMIQPAPPEGMDSAASSPAGDKGKILGKCPWDM